MNEICVLIPAYQPDNKLLELVSELSESNYLGIVIVNDGSSTESDGVFEHLKSIKNTHLLSHCTNIGKGAAIKTGLNYIAQHFPTSKGCVTADADGQHSIKDIHTCAKFLAKNPTSLILGVRGFTHNVPLRSKIGNSLTKYIFNFVTGLKIKDTQTGLRGIPRSFFSHLVCLRSNNYEFELSMLLTAQELKINIEQHTIETLYFDNNSKSHFNPILDSLKIYFILIRFISSSIATSLIDYFIFITSLSLGQSLLVSQYSARTVAGIFNFLVNRNKVFLSNTNIIKSLFLYSVLVYSMGTASYFMIKAATQYLSLNIYFAKIGSEALLFITNFTVQKYIIFKRK